LGGKNTLIRDHTVALYRTRREAILRLIGCMTIHHSHTL
jgi:hypothetical protein